VIGAALTYDQVYGDEVVLKSATVTKLTRNMFLAAAIPYLTWAHAQQYSDVAAGKAVDKMALLKKSSFVLGFIGMSCVRTVGDLGLEDYGLALGLFDAEMWKGICKFVGNELSGHYLLGTAMAAVGLSTSRSDVQVMGAIGSQWVQSPRHGDPIWRTDRWGPPAPVKPCRAPSRSCSHSRRGVQDEWR
jgi:uncharacterized membrane protein YadS